MRDFLNPGSRLPDSASPLVLLGRRHEAHASFAEDFAASVFSPEAKGRASEPSPLATRGVGDAATTERPAAVAAVVVPPTSPATAARKETPQPPREPPRERSMWELWYR